MPDGFYDELAAVYHLIFNDWGAAIARQAEVLQRLLPPPDQAGLVLDGACGIGTQALGLAARGYRLEGSDLSEAAVERASREAAARGLCIRFRVDDLRALARAPKGAYGAVLALDNALPHLLDEDELRQALAAMHERLAQGGTWLVSLRPYDALLRERPTIMAPAFYTDAGSVRRIVHQVWDWQDERRYFVHLYLTRQTPQGWQSQHFVGQYRAVTPAELAALAVETGFGSVRVWEPEQTGFYQPILTAKRVCSP